MKNKLRLALIFYSLCAAGKLGYFHKKYKARDHVIKFEDRHRISTGIFKTAERMFL